jgi:lipopolysaccharide/colanic/teichoic acid biosynthesis glycosyltransferase
MANRHDAGAAIAPVDTRAILGYLATRDLPQTTLAVLREHLPTTGGGSDACAVVDDLSVPGRDPARAGLGLLVGRRSLNQVQRLNNYLREATNRVAKGGYFAAEYLPMEVVLAGMRQRYPRRLYVLAYVGYFVLYRALPKVPVVDRLYFHPMLAWFDRFLQHVGHGRNRSLSRAEVWGRLAYYGFEVIHESSGPGPRVILAQRMTEPVANRQPSFYAIVALEKVGLDGEAIRLHKVRSMYPFSEFLQKKIFESHGLSNTGKFRNDFRLTDYGPLIRRSWIDEIPGLIDWLRGDLKLVGMRATSPHFLSLYPKDVYNLYVQVKPGLIPPIFDEKTTGFAQIVSIERAYLTRYLSAPIRTDIQYFWYTFRDIFLRRVRSS